jgi:copper resistance protein B
MTKRRRMRTLKMLLIAGAHLIASAPLWAQDHQGHSPPVGTPDNARDPHAYSAGFTLTEGPYALPGAHQLEMHDEHKFASLMANRFEYDVDNESGVYDLQGWAGTTYDRFVLKAEGDVANGSLAESQTELFWGHAIAAHWDTQLGLRLDSADGREDRQWVAFGIQGFTPYWFEVDVTAYLGVEGRTALSVELDYELLFTQRLILQPRAEFTLYGKSDEVNGVGRGLSDAALGLRLRYEFSRQFAPYIGFERTGKYGRTADFAKALDEPKGTTSYVVGLRFWF